MNNEPHIASAFDRDLEAIQAMIVRMAGLVETSLLQAAEALETRDEELADTVREGDKVIDDLELQINTEAARMIALRAPAASDLRTALSVIKIASSLERCGDYTKNLAKRSNVLAQLSPVGGSTGSIRRIAKAVQLQLAGAIDAYIKRDYEMAIEVRNRDKDIDQMYNALFREFLTHMMEDPSNITACMHLHFIAKNIERLGDHATGIAEQVIYLITGHLPEERRPKGSLPSSAAEK
ncbi:MAG: phosphate signaling complex protein PhoU [Paracoccaceae bacterium]|nr:phosphate signaling complex protein PhoU [Paracoccaceae bacterium]